MNIHLTDRLTAHEGDPPRLPPHNIDAEQALLGALFLDNSVLDKLPGDFGAEHFFDGLHGQIFDTIRGLHGAGRPATPVTLQSFYDSAEPIDPPRYDQHGTLIHKGMTVGQYLGRLASAAASTRNAPEYARTVRDLAVRRRLIAIAEELLDGAYEAAVDVPPETIAETAEAALFRMGERVGDNTQVTLRQAASEAVEHAYTMFQAGSGIVGFSSGLVDLDEKLGGLGETDLIILAGRPSMGKTALAANIAKTHASRPMPGNNGPAGTQRQPFVHFFSMEMQGSQLANRFLAEHVEISSHDIRRGALKEDDFRRLNTAAEELGRLPFLVDQSGGLTIAQLAARARRVQRMSGTTMIIIDYLQLMRGAKSRSSDNRTNELTEITMGLKALAKELQVPIICLSQLSRAVEQRADKRPQLSDLRESGSIEQDADVVLFAFREEYYLEREQPDESDLTKLATWRAQMEAARGKAEIIIGKQRHGPTGIVNVAFEGRYTRFSDLARGDQFAGARHA